MMSIRYLYLTTCISDNVRKIEIYVNIPLNGVKKQLENGKKQLKDPGFDQNHKPMTKNIRH